MGAVQAVEKRLADVEKDSTFLCAKVQLRATYDTHFNARKLEQLLHQFFAHANRQVEVVLRKHIVPKEWFVGSARSRGRGRAADLRAQHRQLSLRRGQPQDSAAMRPAKKQQTAKSVAGPHKKATYTLPPECSVPLTKTGGSTKRSTRLWPHDRRRPRAQAGLQRPQGDDS